MTKLQLRRDDTRQVGEHMRTDGQTLIALVMSTVAKLAEICKQMHTYTQIDTLIRMQSVV